MQPNFHKKREDELFIIISHHVPTVSSMEGLPVIERLDTLDPLEISGNRKALKISEVCGEPVGIGYGT